MLDTHWAGAHVCAGAGLWRRAAGGGRIVGSGMGGVTLHGGSSPGPFRFPGISSGHVADSTCTEPEDMGSTAFPGERITGERRSG